MKYFGYPLTTLPNSFCLVYYLMAREIDILYHSLVLYSPVLYLSAIAGEYGQGCFQNKRNING
ncbi:hypothetical protein ETAA8_66230 [Anatilimnocola aggregata]|uniref:Uncharacterized protein n=1 Tax=Anatilimnocola aggregata TaxID=2528021 RepID=A0A517YML6_9BACT|nr:hypothetical protein ETAA8_66230 [Anatilimnocola aggregata]